VHTHLDRRRFLRNVGALGAATLVPATAGALAREGLLATGDGEDAPRTGFEERDGASWTTHEEELDFLAEVAARSERAAISTIAWTQQGRPVQLAAIGAPAPRAADTAQAEPTVLFVCTQHGNEPAGREAGLQLVRDLAFTTDPVLVRQLEAQTVLVVPTANPDGRAANRRDNFVVDINRDHLILSQPETQGIHRVIGDWSPDLILDLHEYGPSVPVLYDAEILYLWPRNLNVDPQVRDLSRTLCREYIRKGAEAGGFTADEYGLYKVDEVEVTQTAGDEDEGICRNAVGLRHRMGVLIESAVSPSARRGAEEVVSTAANQRRRVACQNQTVVDTLRFLREQGGLAKHASDGAPFRAISAGEEQAPVYWRGADNDPPSAADIDDPAAWAYRLTDVQAADLAGLFALQGIVTETFEGGIIVPMAQPARPVIPQLLDGRARRHVTQAAPLYDRDPEP
jgi:hypothetical protein